MQQVSTAEPRILAYLRTVPDPRVIKRSKHILFEVLFITLCAVLCGATSYVDIAEFAEDRIQWLRKFLPFVSAPSHDTIARVLSVLDVNKLEEAFRAWVADLGGNVRGHVSIDGKVIRGTSRSFQGSKTLSVVSVYASSLGLVIGQERSAGRGALETEATLKALEGLILKGTLVSVDAGVGSRRVTTKIRESGANYIVPIKRWSLKEIKQRFPKKPSQQASEEQKAHGRMESRTAEVISANRFSEQFKTQWQDVKTVIKMTRERGTRDTRYSIQHPKRKGKTKYTLNKNIGKMKVAREVTYYVSSKKLSAIQALTSCRKHWDIENKLHWKLDVIFLEDSWKVRQKTAAMNMSIIRRMGINLVSSNTAKGSNRVKLKRAAWSPDFLEELVIGQTGIF